METLGLGLMAVAYSVLIITLFLQIICYRRKIENIETILFTISLLCLIVSLFFQKEPISFCVFISMILISVTTFTSILSERKYTISNWIRYFYFFIAAFLGLGTIFFYFQDNLSVMEMPIAVFLGISVVLSMMIINVTQPL